MRNNVVLALLPKAGLANKLLVWAEALVYAKKNKYKFYILGWRDFKIGPYIRNEIKKRRYFFFFTYKNKPNIFKLIIFFIFYKKIYFNSRNHKNISNTRKKYLLVFSKVPNWDDYFHNLRGSEELIRKSFYNMLSSKYKKIYDSDDSPTIGLHIRCSDFVYNEDLMGISPNIRTPLNYFVEIIKKIRFSIKKNIKVTVFSDGNYSEISEIFSLENVFFSKSSSDLEDLIKLSKSKLIITSYSSTFSYWAAYLSSAPVILHPKHKIQIRKEISGVFQGSIDLNKPFESYFLEYLKHI